MNNTGDSIKADNANWRFDGGVSKTFNEHVQRSIPFYTTSHDLIVKISDFFLSEGSNCYDIGCSTGTLLDKLAKHHSPKKITFIGVDNQPEMLQKAASLCKEHEQIAFQQADLVDIEWEKADLIIAHYTLQFIKPKNRQLVFNRIFEALNWGGGFLLFEKVRAADARFQDMMGAIYTDYKLDQNYQPEEIVAKARSLKGVLEPFSTQGNYDLLQRAGFIDMMTVMKYVSFEGILAIK
ncbi:MAG: methyltransferase domain-containing protein [Candidatus Omnitrophica bacterium]|nr:methyltransferase domain-containing protein [Candidatus Omnitrophota bacterium]